MRRSHVPRPFCNMDVHMCAVVCYRVVHCGMFCLVHRGVRVIGLLVIYFTIGDPTSSRLKHLFYWLRDEDKGSHRDSELWDRILIIMWLWIRQTAPQQYCRDACRVTLWPCASISQLRASVGSCNVRPLRPCSTGSSISLLTIECISSCISNAHTEIHKTMPRHISAVFLKTCAIDLPTELATVKPEFHELHWCDLTHLPL